MTPFAASEITSERLRDTLTRNAVAFTSIDVTAPDQFRISGVTDDAGLRNATADAEATYDRDATGGVYTFKIKPNIANQLRDEAVTQALQTIERRVNELGVARPSSPATAAAIRSLSSCPASRTSSGRSRSSAPRRSSSSGWLTIPRRSRRAKPPCRRTTTRCRRMSRFCPAASKDPAQPARGNGLLRGQEGVGRVR